MMNVIKNHKIAVTIIVVVLLLLAGVLLFIQQEEPIPIAIDNQQDTGAIVVKPGQNPQAPPEDEASSEDNNPIEANAASEFIHSIPGFEALIVRSARIEMQDGEYKLVHLTIYDSSRDTSYIDTVITKNDTIITAITGVHLDTSEMSSMGIPEKILNAYWESMDNGQ